MTFLIFFCLHVTILKSISSQILDDLALTAITNFSYQYLHQLYSEEVNSDSPTRWEDKTKSDLIHRLRICEEITNSDAFHYLGRSFINLLNDPQRLLDQLKKPEYERIYRDLFIDGKLNNRYKPRKFNIGRASTRPRPPDEDKDIFVEDFVFACLSRLEVSYLIPIYITKVYRADSKLHAHRFILEDRRGYLSIMLAEAPAEVHASLDFSLEVHYLDLKRDNPTSMTVANRFQDPVGRLTKNGQFHRLCVVVFSSVHFKSKVTRVRQFYEWGSRVVKFTFRTEEGEGVAEESPYFELVNGGDKTFYLSRAYKDHEVLVSAQDPSDGKFYLENLFINVGMLTEDSISDDVHT